jgi:hypothetical protein
MSGLIKDLKKFNRLSRIANSTLGSNGPGGSGYTGTTTQHLRFELINERTIKAHYQGAIAVPSKSMLSTLMGKLVSDALSSIKRGTENFAREYKEQFDKSITLTINENSVVDNVEFTSYSVFRPTQSGMLRVTALIEVTGGDDVEDYFEKMEKTVQDNVDNQVKHNKKLIDQKKPDGKTKQK